MDGLVDGDWDGMDVERLIEERGRPRMKWGCCSKEEEDAGCEVGLHQDQTTVTGISSRENEEDRPSCKEEEDD